MANVSLIAQVGVALIISLVVLSSAVGLAQSLSQAKSTGLRYVILPFFPLGVPWLMLQPLLVPLFRLLPFIQIEPWLTVLLIDNAWHNGHVPFELMGVDTFIGATPGGCVLFTCDPEVNAQILREGTFKKPTEHMQLLNAFGPALTACDGPEGRLYRRTAAPFFTEQNMRNIWRASIDGGQHLMSALTKQEKAYSRLREIMTKYTVNLLNQLAFETQPDYERELRFDEVVPAGRKISYSDAIIKAADNLVTYMSVPGPILSYVNPEADTAKKELDRYLQEMRRSKEAEISQQKSSQRQSSLSLLDLIVGAHLNNEERTSLPFTAEAVSGNIFILNLAGSESSANALAFMLIILACRPELQQAVQRDLDSILGSTPPEQWNYEESFSRLMNSTVGAVIYETLRVYTVIPMIPRQTFAADGSVPLIVDGSTYSVPSGMLCLLNTSATHRNPKYWHASAVGHPGSGETKPFPLANFDHRRWQVDKGDSKSLLEPQPGSFISFSDGPRGCLGRRFAIIEICAVLAILLKSHTVRLVVSDGLAKADALRKAEWALSGGVKFGHSLRATQHVPIRFEKR